MASAAASLRRPPAVARARVGFETPTQTPLLVASAVPPSPLTTASLAPVDMSTRHIRRRSSGSYSTSSTGSEPRPPRRTDLGVDTRIRYDEDGARVTYPHPQRAPSPSIPASPLLLTSQPDFSSPAITRRLSGGGSGRRLSDPLDALLNRSSSRNRLDSNADAGTPSGAPSTPTLCRSCKDAAPSVKFLPCSHVCLCRVCYDGGGVTHCPLCRFYIVDVETL